MDASPPAVFLQQAQRPRWRRLVARLGAIFWLSVALPGLLAIGYFGFLASDVYVAESRFVVRSPQRQTPTGLGALLQGTGFARSQDDTYSVHDFIRSRDALRELDTKLNVANAFSRPEIDPVNRFPGIAWWEKSFEALYRHYLKHVSVDYDTVSSISILRVRAYNAEDARAMNEALLQMGEHLVNNLNIRSRQDLIQVAEQEVRIAEQRARDAAASLSAFRSNRAVFDPERQGMLQLQGVARLREELLAAQTQLNQMRQLSPLNPQIPVFEQRVATLNAAISADNARIVASDGGLTAKSPQFDRLTIDKGFADRQLGATMAALDSARSEAARKQLYLERLVQPNLPDDASEPRRIRSILVVFALGLVAWGVLSLLVASVREHTD